MKNIINCGNRFLKSQWNYGNYSNYKNIFHIIKRNFARRDDVNFESDIQQKLKEKFENKNSKTKKTQNVSEKYADIRFDVRCLLTLENSKRRLGRLIKELREARI
jgi:hypothetical protein